MNKYLLSLILLSSVISGSAQVQGNMASWGASFLSVRQTFPIINAARHNDLPALKKAFDSVSNWQKLAANTTGGPLHSTPMMYAAQYGNLEMARYLKSKGALVNNTNDKKNTALGYAIEYKHEQVAGYLIDLHAHLDAKHYVKADNYAEGIPLLEFAIKQGLHQTAQKMFNNMVQKKVFIDKAGVLYALHLTANRPLLMHVIKTWNLEAEEWQHTAPDGKQWYDVTYTDKEGKQIASFSTQNQLFVGLE